MQNKDTLYLNGMKGTACIIVFLMHFVNAFYPAVFNGEGLFASHFLWDLDAKITQTPLMSLINGRLMVGVFMVISGMVITLQVMRCTDRQKLASIVFKRYFRFTFVLLIFCTIVFILRSANLFFAEECAAITDARGSKGFYAQEFRFIDIFTHAFYFIPFTKSTAFSLAFWCIKDMLIGSFVSILLGLVAHNARKRILIVFFIFYAVLAYRNCWFSAYVLGSILAFIYMQYPLLFDDSANIPSRLAFDVSGIVFFLIGMAIGTYPWRIQPTNFYANLGALLPESVNKADFYEVLGGFLIVAGLSISSIHFIFDTKIFKFLGKISFSVFLIHVPVIYSVGAGLMIFLYNLNGKYIVNTVIVFAVVTSLTIVLSYLFNKYAETFCTKLLNKLISSIYKTDTITGENQ